MYIVDMLYRGLGIYPLKLFDITIQIDRCRPPSSGHSPEDVDEKVDTINQLCKTSLSCSLQFSNVIS